MWRGAIQFGLVTIPVKLYLATESRGGLSFNLLHKECLNRIQMKTHCPEHGEISRTDTVRGYEWSKGQYVVIDEGDLESVPLKTVRSIEIELFVDSDRTSHGVTFVKQAYYLEPEPVGRKAFYLLKQVLADDGLQAVCKIVLKDREALAAISPYTNTMVLTTLYWPDEVRAVGELDLPTEEFEFKPQELAMAQQLVATMKGEFDAADYTDDYRQALLDVIQRKIDGQPAVKPEPVVATSKLTDLMSVLEASLAAAKASKSGDGAATEKPAAAATPKRASRSRAAAAEAPEELAVARTRAASGTRAKRAAPATPEPAASGRKAAAVPAERKRKSA
jgi:DNA end-binding protein Ku